MSDLSALSLRLSMIEDWLRDDCTARNSGDMADDVHAAWKVIDALSDGFRVGGFDDESGDYDQPVEVRCGRCRAGQSFSWRDDGGADYTEDLSVSVAWARDHRCEAKR